MLKLLTGSRLRGTLWLVLKRQVLFYLVYALRSRATVNL